MTGQQILLGQEFTGVSWYFRPRKILSFLLGPLVLLLRRREIL